jgi:hypothetical protein
MAKKALSGGGGIGGLIAAKARRCGGSESICVADIFYGVEYAIVLTEDTIAYVRSHVAPDLAHPRMTPQFPGSG